MNAVDEFFSSPQSVVIRTALLPTAIDLASLIDAYCVVYTPNPHSRMTGGVCGCVCVCLAGEIHDKTMKCQHVHMYDSCP